MTVTTNVQVGAAITGAPLDNNDAGLVSFDDTMFTVDANGFVQLIGAGGAVDSIGVDIATLTGTNPVLPDGTGLITVTGGQIPASGLANVIRTDSKAVNQYTIEIQQTTTSAASDPTKNGVAHFDVTRFTMGGNGFVTTSGTGVGNTITGQSGGALSPTAGNWNIFGGTVAAGTTPVSTSGAVSTLTTNVQRSQAVAATNATNNGLSHYYNADFAVDANGFVTLSATGAGKTITGDSGGALSPAANNWNILGRSGSKTSGSGSTLTVNSPPYADGAAPASVTLNSGTFATAAITLTTPVTAGLANGDLLEFVATNGVLIIQLAATQVAHLGSAVTSVAGTITGTATGDSISLRYQSSTNDWWTTSSVGIWVLA